MAKRIESNGGAVQCTRRMGVGVMPGGRAQRSVRVAPSRRGLGESPRRLSRSLPSPKKSRFLLSDRRSGRGPSRRRETYMQLKLALMLVTLPEVRLVHDAPLKRIWRYELSVYSQPLVASCGTVIPSKVTTTWLGRAGAVAKR